LDTELTDHRLQRIDLAWREHPPQQLAVHVVDRRVFEDQHARRDVEVGLDQLQDYATRRTERGVVDQRLIDVGEPAQREEGVFRVVVKRRLVAQAREHRIRVGDELDIVWIETNMTLSARRHEIPPSTATSRCLTKYRSRLYQGWDAQSMCAGFGWANLYTPLKCVALISARTRPIREHRWPSVDLTLFS
jgi:hypothetical protein